MAESATDQVTTTVNLNGSFCFRHLTPDLYTVTAFPRAFASYSKPVMAVAGKTVRIYLDRRGE